jgi:hypothetical protein
LVARPRGAARPTELPHVVLLEGKVKLSLTHLGACLIEVPRHGFQPFDRSIAHSNRRPLAILSVHIGGHNLIGDTAGCSLSANRSSSDDVERERMRANAPSGLGGVRSGVCDSPLALVACTTTTCCPAAAQSCSSCAR